METYDIFIGSKPQQAVTRTQTVHDYKREDEMCLINQRCRPRVALPCVRASLNRIHLDGTEI